MYVCFSPKCPKKPVFYGNASKLIVTLRKSPTRKRRTFSTKSTLSGGWISFHFAVKPQNFTSAKPLFHILPSGNIFHCLPFPLIYSHKYAIIYQETGIFAVCVSIRAMLIASVNKAKTINHLSMGILKNETDFIRRIQCPKTLWRDAVRFLSENKIGCERVVI